MKKFTHVDRILLADRAGVRPPSWPARIAGIIASAMIPVAAQAQGGGVSPPGPPELAARIAQIKAETAALVASARPRLDALSPQQRLSALRWFGTCRARSPNSRTAPTVRRWW